MGVKVVGFVDNNLKKVGKHINGVKVYDKAILTEDFVKYNNISEVIFFHTDHQSKTIEDVGKRNS